MSKDLGLLSELRFQLAAVRRGFVVSSPSGDNAPYDFVIDNGINLLKVQVKGTTYTSPDGYFFFQICNGIHKLPYTEGQVDFFALYIEPLRIFFIIPQALLKGRKAVRINEHGKFKYFKENWDFST